MDLGLTGKAAMITGASRGIGKDIARGLAAEGCRLSVCARGSADLEETVRELREDGAEVLASTLDVTDEAAARAWFAETRERFQDVDILINNVGGSRPGGNLSASGEDWQRGFDLNFFSALDLCRLVVPSMRERKRGCVINIASIYGREWGGPMTYNAAKAAMISLSKEMARELASDGVRVNSVAPGSILFPGGSWERRRREQPVEIAAFVERELPAGRFGKPEEVADVVVFLASERANWISGACINVDGCQSRSLI
ncbi:MAG: SDR family NAD(P)-dependent oxidoreductase [Deltaproteobacteria bacterium]|nr:SDR family NAD(P)-dependent oxidoreductase [Deltaproteobacteria bacterium]